MDNGRGYGGGGGRGCGMGNGMGRGGGGGGGGGRRDGVGQRRGGGRGMWRCQEAAAEDPATEATEPRDAAQQTRALRTHAHDMINQLSAIAHRLAELEASRANSSAARRRPSTAATQETKRFLRMTARVDQERCTCCAACVDSCPEQAIRMNDVVTIESNVCTGCGSCINECPNEAISLSDTLRRVVV